MNLSDRDILQDVVISIMTEMFFIFPDMDDDGNPEQEGTPAPDCVHVGIHFNTQFYMHFRIDRNMLVEMAANFMGLGPDEVDQSAIESMAMETANIIGGNYLVRIDPEHQFRLSIPEILDGSTVDFSTAMWQIGYVAEGQVMLINPIPR